MRIGRYEVVGPLAVGGMAEIHLARVTGVAGFERLVVIKRLKPELGHDEQLVQAFLDEARILAAIRHANIVQVHDVGVDGALPFLAMELLEGQDCARILERGRPLPLRQALAITLGVCAGLHAAHEGRSPDGASLELVHRDVSPENVFVTYDGGVKVIDFGVARAAGRLSETRFGIVKGKPGYMSPEQARCEPLDRRSDVYAIGVLLYELTTGSRPFTATNEYDLLRLVAEATPPPPSERIAGYPPALARIVTRALATDRDARYSSARGLERDLEPFAAAEGLTLGRGELGAWLTRLFDVERAALERARTDGTLAEHVIAAATGRRSAAVPASAQRSRRPLPLAGIVAAGLGLALAVALAAVWPRAAGDTVAIPPPARALAPPAAAPAPAPAPAEAAPPVADPAPAAPVLLDEGEVVREDPIAHPRRRVKRRRARRATAPHEAPAADATPPAGTTPAGTPHVPIDPDALLPR